MAAELGSYKQAHTSSPPLTLGNSRVVEGPAPLKELGSRAQAMRGGISKLRGVFDKKYEQSFTDEVFKVTESIPRTPPVYKLQDYDGEPIKGSFYEAELQKVKIDRDKMYAVEKILKSARAG
ncbi:hypothetical protein L3Q82_021010 [Scortum barcoo]|uniref:Uncharacterized protein n=1 Tax=Scortum barcoo TaxID=214431 RepID=A0ACB8X3E0_9TELE|nr:hypothetical protein L3Q82_021010 [Scortum barcoo]